MPDSSCTQTRPDVRYPMPDTDVDANANANVNINAMYDSQLSTVKKNSS